MNKWLSETAPAATYNTTSLNPAAHLQQAPHRVDSHRDVARVLDRMPWPRQTRFNQDLDVVRVWLQFAFAITAANAPWAKQPDELASNTARKEPFTRRIVAQFVRSAKMHRVL